MSTLSLIKIYSYLPLLPWKILMKNNQCMSGNLRGIIQKRNGPKMNSWDFVIQANGTIKFKKVKQEN